jgi:hypothetical protein
MVNGAAHYGTGRASHCRTFSGCAEVIAISSVGNNPCRTSAGVSAALPVLFPMPVPVLVP